MMAEFNISRGLSTVLFTSEGDVNPNLLIEEGCWYLCTDTAELFLGVQTEDGLTLRQINDVESHPVIAEVKTKVETVLIPKVEEEIVPTIEEVKSTTDELKAWVDNKDFLQHIDLKGYATEDFVNDAIAQAELGGADVDLAGYATEGYVDEKIAAIKLLDSEIYKVDFDAPNYTAAVEAYNDGKVLVLINAAPDTNSYAVMNYVNDNYITFTKFLMSRSEAYGAFNTYYLKSDNTWEVAKEVKLNKVEVTSEGGLLVGKQTYSFATEKFVADKIAEAALTNKEVNLDDYYTKSEVEALIPDVSEFIKEIPGDYVTDSELSAKGYLTEQDISGKADKEHSHSEYLTDQDISNKSDVGHKHSISDITDAPTIPSLDGYATEQYVGSAIATAIVEKANEKPFTTDKFVNNPIGGFSKNDNIKDWTIAEILAKLLELSDIAIGENPEDPDMPSIPETTEEIIKDITNNDRPLYQLNSSGEREDITHVEVTFEDEQTHLSAPEETVFYQANYTNEQGEVITEAGYQHVTEEQPEMYYTIMLPNYLVVGENVKIQSWSAARNMWMDAELTGLTNDLDTITTQFESDGLTMPEIPEGYAFWVDFDQTNPGNKLRYIIIDN